MSGAGRAVLAAALSACLLLAGCAELTDIDQKALVVGITVDAGTTPGTNVVGIQYVVPGQGQGDQGGPALGGGGTAETGQGVSVCDQGTSVAAALQALRDETARFIYLGNLGLIAIGSALAQRDAVSALNYFQRDGQVAEATQVVVVAGPACAFLQKKTAASGADTLSLFRYMQSAERVTFPASPNVLWRFLSEADSPTAAAYAPLVATSDQGAPFRVLGSALFLRGKMVGRIEGYQATAFDWLVKNAGFPDALVNLPPTSGPVALHVRTVAQSVRVLGPAEAALTLRVAASVREGDVTLNAQDLRPVESALGEQLQAQERGVVDQLQAHGTDVIGIGDQVLARYPAEAADWPATFSHMKIDLRVQLHLFEGGRMP